MEEPKRHEVNVNYAVYSPDGKFISGFDGLREVDKYLGHKYYGAISSMKKAREKIIGSPIVYRYYDEKNDIYECSIKFFEYVSNTKNELGSNPIDSGLTIFKFWEEVSDEQFRRKEY